MLRFLRVLAACVAFGQVPKNPLVEYNKAIDDLIRRVAPRVVQIVVNGYGFQDDSERRNTGTVIGRQRVIGSGFVIDPEGYIMTNAHLVNGAAAAGLEDAFQNSAGDAA
jgi:S1-C subfamily serine protease